jgi:hypothetical protein
MPIFKTREGDSNVTIEKEKQSVKQNSSSPLTEQGIQIDESDQQPRNTEGSIEQSREAGSNAIVERELHWHISDVLSGQSVSTDEAMQTWGVGILPFDFAAWTGRATPQMQIRFRVSQTGAGDVARRKTASDPSEL